MTAQWGLATVVVLLAAGCGSTVADVDRNSASSTGDEVTVYVGKEVADHNSRSLLHPHQVPVEGESTVEAAVETLTVYRPQGAFYTLWDGFCSLGEDLDQVTVTKSLVTVHFTEGSGATCDMSRQGWQLRRQQIAWTVRTATGSTAPVRVTVGRDNYEAEHAVIVRRRYLAGSQTETLPSDISCQGKNQVVTDLDFFGRENGFTTPEAAAHDWSERYHADAEVAVSDRNPDGATALILRRYGTAHTRMRIDRSANGWFVGGYQACAGHNPMR